MPLYRYSALSSTGELVTGALAAQDEATVIARLHDWALIPISAEENAGRLALRAAGGGRHRPIRTADLALLAQQLARLLQAGVPVDRALRLLISVTGRRNVAARLRETLDRLTAGASLADAMQAGEGAFLDSFVSMVRAGEAAGALNPVLVRTADFLARAEAMRQKVISSLVYPVILVVVSIGAVTLVLTVVVPQFEPLFDEAGARLPTSTRVVMAISAFLRAYGWIALPIGLAAAAAWWRFSAVDGVVLWRDRMVLRLPIAGTLVTKLNIGRFCRMLGTLLANGVPAAQALALCGNVVTNRSIASAIFDVADRFKEGEGLSSPLATTGLFPTLSTQLIRIGEETGRLDELLQEISTLYDHDVQRTLDRLLTLLVPALTVLMGLIIGGIVVSILVAMLAVNNLAG